MIYASGLRSTDHVKSPMYPGTYKIKDMSDISSVFMKKILIIASPLLINEFMWALGETMYSIVYATMRSYLQSYIFHLQEKEIGIENILIL